MKRGMSLLLVFVMLVSMIPAAAAAEGKQTKTWSDDLFTDVAVESWYHENVKTAYELSLMNGTGDRKFNPEGDISLAEAITLAARIHSIYTTGEDNFKQGNPWYQVYVDYARAHHILDGLLVDYSQKATRLEVARLFARALPEEALAAINTVEDGAIPDLERDADVYMLYRAGVLTGSDANGTFNADATIKRSEVAAIAARMVDSDLRKSVTLRNESSTTDEPEEEEDTYVPSRPSYNYPDYDDPTFDYPEYDYPTYDDPSTEEEDTSSPSDDEDEVVIDENNALTVPFDQAYPDLFASGEINYSGEQILIKVADAPTGEQQAALNNAGVTGLEHIMDTASAKWYKAYVGGNVNDVMDAVRALSFVQVAEYDFAYESDAIETGAIIDCNKGDMDGFNGNDRVYDQWYLRTGGIKKSWDHLKKPHKRPHYDENKGEADFGEDAGTDVSGTEAGQGILVAVIDTGVDYTHEDLKGNIFINEKEIPDNNKDDDGNGYVDDYYGYNAVAGKGSAMDDQGHGTHVAGIIAAANNEMGIVGIAYNATILPIKAGMASGYFNSSDIAEAITYASKMGADVINMSFGGVASTTMVADALQEAYTNSVLVAAAGNDGYPNEVTDYYDIPMPTYPAAYSYVLGVMSVDHNGVESDFTNWDAKSFNSVEYEVYAPGEAMISTIPNNQYATWNGTSMAAPVVSGIAALLRSEFRDNNTYPTKFIYGQICGTGDTKATCIDPKNHTVNGEPHSMASIVDLYNALTIMPEPDVSMTEYTMFDTAGLEGNTKNNGDGVIDAGETIALGFELRNKWGKSADTVISVTTNDPYVTVHNPTIAIGAVGTYSTNDCGKVIENDAFVGWKNPVYITIHEDCPNDYIFKLNVTVTCKNGLDSGDTTVYSNSKEIDLDVRSGVVLPNLIEADMVLTPDNYYIIPNATLIMEGATVTVQPGTQIQFWSDDANDAYADDYIAYLNVEGTLICNGTAEEPIKMFPSERMGQYRVEINGKNNGSIRLFHTDVVNPYLAGITYAEGCQFSQMYPRTYLLYRYLSGGTVQSSSSYSRVQAEQLRECAYYKLGDAVYSYVCESYGDHYNCIFVDSRIVLRGTYEGCLFYGNNNYENYEKGFVSNITLGTTVTNWDARNKAVTDPETGTTYVRAYTSGIVVAERFAELLGGHLAIVETEKELSFIDTNFHIPNYYGDTKLGILRDYRDDSLRWVDGSPLGSFIDLDVDGAGGVGCYSCGHDTFNLTHNDTGYYLIEIPGTYVEEILLDDYAVTMDTDGATWQIGATVLPTDAANAVLIYESMDESVATVSAGGVITPVGGGTTVIRVYSPDRAVYNTVDVTVTEAVALESIELGENFRLAIGESKQLNPVLIPAHTSKRYLTYESSDLNVATVSTDGLVTVSGVGAAVITAVNPETGKSDFITVEGYIPVTAVTVEELLFATSVTSAETVDVLGVTVFPSNATYQTLTWESSNPEILYVDESGNLVKLQEGTATLSATEEVSGLYAEVTVCLSDMDTEVTVVQMERGVFYDGNYVMALLSDGSLWMWGNKLVVPQRIGLEDENGNSIFVKQFAISTESSYITATLLTVDNSGVMRAYSAFPSDSTFELGSLIVADVVDVAANNKGSYGSFYYLKSDGSVWAWGKNSYGQLGINNKDDQSVPVEMITESIEGTIVDIETNDDLLVARTAEEEMYFTGRENSYNATVLTWYNSGIIGFQEYNNRIALEYADHVENFMGGSVYTKYGEKTYLFSGNANNQYYIDDGVLYAKGSVNSSGELGVGIITDVNTYTPVNKVQNVIDIFSVGENRTVYVQTADGKFYGMGENDVHQIPNLTTVNQPVPSRIYFGLSVDSSVPVVEKTNLTTDEETTASILNETALVLDFDWALTIGSKYASITLADSSGATLSVYRTLKLDEFILQPRGGFIAGEAYTLTIPADAFISKFGVSAEAITLTFTAGEGAVSVGTSDDTGSDNSDGTVTNDEDIVYETVVNPDFTGERTSWTEEVLLSYWDDLMAENINPKFYRNALINRLNDDAVTKWLRVQGTTADSYTEIPVGGNWWGTTNPVLINEQILDFYDFQTLADLNETPYLTEAPGDVWPFVVDAWLEDGNGQRVDIIGNELVTFCVRFNRPMDTTIPLDVRFGSAYPYADYDVEGEWVSSTLWKGTTTLTTLIEAGYQFWSVDNGCAADNAGLTLYKDWGRFPFEIDTSSALAMILQGVAGDEGVALEWTQDDYAESTLAGYNVYRAEQDEDAYYQRLNSSLIPAGTKEFFDDTVEPGKVYYYIFTAVLTDFSETEPSGKIRIVSKDTMAPSLYHTPVYSAYENRNVVISATANDNVGLSAVTLYYRIVGTEDWTEVEMTKLNDKYSAYISGNVTAEALGANIEYYVTAFDGVSIVSRGSAAEPYTIVVQADPGEQMMGDVDGNGRITILDALRVLRAINNKIVLTAEEFARADLDGSENLTAAEALKILKYANGEIGSL